MTTTTPPVTDEDVIRWATERWLKENTDPDGREDGDDVIVVDDGLTELEHYLGEAVAALDEHVPAAGVKRHLIERVLMWVYVDGSHVIDGIFLTVDLPADGSLYVGQSLEGRDFVDSAVFGIGCEPGKEGLPAGEFYQQLITSTLTYAQAMLDRLPR